MTEGRGHRGNDSGIRGKKFVNTGVGVEEFERMTIHQQAPERGFASGDTAGQSDEHGHFLGTTLPVLRSGRWLFPPETLGSHARPFEIGRQAERFDDFFLVRVVLGTQQLSGRIHQARGDEDDQVTFDLLVDFRTEQGAREGHIPENWDLVVDLLNILSDKPAESDGLTIPDADVGGHLAFAEDWLVDDVLGE